MGTTHFGLVGLRVDWIWVDRQGKPENIFEEKWPWQDSGKHTRHPIFVNLLPQKDWILAVLDGKTEGSHLANGRMLDGLDRTDSGSSTVITSYILWTYLFVITLID